MKSRFIFVYFLSLILFITFADITLAAQFAGYQPLASIPEITGSVATDGTDLSAYLNSLYKMGVAAAAGLAVIMVIWGGVEYITSVAGEGKSGGKERITSAILGLLLALGSYIILNTINPDLLKLTFTLPDAKVNVNVGNAVAPRGAVMAGQLGAAANTFGYTRDANGNILYNNLPTGYSVDDFGNIVDRNGNPASYINDTPLNTKNFNGSFQNDGAGIGSDPSVTPADSNLANALAQSATNAYGQNLGQGTSQRVACASTTCSILNNSGLNYGNITYTPDLAAKMLRDPSFQANVLAPGTQIQSGMVQGGSVVLTESKGGVSGHVGVVNTYGTISNNDSNTGLVKTTTVGQWNTGVIQQRPTLRTIIFTPR